MANLNYFDIAPLGMFGFLDDAIETVPRMLTESSMSVGASTVYLAYAFAPETITITQLGTLQSGGAAASATAHRVGVYTVDASDNLTLVARTAQQTGTYSASGSSEWFYNLAATASTAFTTSYTLQKGQRYALAVHTIPAAGQMPTIRSGVFGLPKATYARSPRIAGAVLSQADLPLTIAASAVADYGHPAPYIAGLP